tara:strand:+ start:6084 stop:7079 length:996 start_codon:yes stop_codon:yes gene_type:complete
MYAEKFKDKNICITGGLGFIGSAIARRLVNIANVTVIDSLIPEYGGNLFNVNDCKEKLDIKLWDVRDIEKLEDTFRDADYIFNMAGQTSHMDSMADPYTDLEINTAAQLSILECVKLCNPSVKVVFASTRQLYGKPDYLPVNESHPIRPVDVNGINKNAGEQYHLLYHQVYGIPTSVLRLTNTYGPGMRIKDARQTFVGVWIKNLIEGMPFEVWGGKQLRDFNYVDDVVDAFFLAALNNEANGEIFNLGSQEVITLSALADKLLSVNGSGDYSVKEFPSERKKIDIGDYYSDSSRITQVLGWEPQINLEEGLMKTINFYKKYGTKYLNTSM